MQGSDILAVQPTADVIVGIRWQMPTAVAAHSMCMEMVFLKDRPTAEAWQAEDKENISLFSLPEAVVFGKAFFSPLLSQEK
jgi:mercuric reductase